MSDTKFEDWVEHRVAPSDRAIARSAWNAAISSVGFTMLGATLPVPRRCPDGDYSYRGWNSCIETMAERIEALKDVES